jgi:hypothetical protein
MTEKRRSAPRNQPRLKSGAKTERSAAKVLGVPNRAPEIALDLEHPLAQIEVRPCGRPLKLDYRPKAIDINPPKWSIRATIITDEYQGSSELVGWRERQRLSFAKTPAETKNETVFGGEGLTARRL